MCHQGDLGRNITCYYLSQPCVRLEKVYFEGLLLFIVRSFKSNILFCFKVYLCFRLDLLSDIMSEVTDSPSVIVPAKSEDKLEIEKEEAVDTVEEGKEDGEEKPAGEEVGEKAAEGSGEAVTEQKDAEGGKGEAEDGEEDGQKDSAEGEKKKFSLSQIKTPKIIKEIRSRSKSRDNKKKVRGGQCGERDTENCNLREFIG